MKKYLKLFLIALIVISLAGCIFASKRQRAFDLTNKARVHYWGKDWQGVVRLTTHAIALEPEYPWPYSVRGAAYSAMGQYDKALKDFSVALWLSPDFSPAITNRGVTYRRMGRFMTAMKDFKEAIMLNPNDIVSMVSMAEIMVINEDINGACQMMLRAVEHGYSDLDHLENSVELRPIYKSDCYDTIVEGVPEQLR